MKCTISRETAKMIVVFTFTGLLLFGCLGYAGGWNAVIIELACIISIVILIGVLFALNKITGYFYDKFCAGETK